jgi:hypothetical protein
MKTYQIFKTVSFEYFVEAESLEEAQTKIIEQQLHADNEELVEWVFADEHDGTDWSIEPVAQS